MAQPVVHPVPGPRAFPFIGNIASFGRNPLAFVSNAAVKYGPIVRFRVEAHRDTYLLSHPDDIESALVHTNRAFAKGYQHDPVMRLVLGNGLVTSEGEFWLRQRRLAQPAFHRAKVSAAATVMVAYTQRMLATWQPGEQRDFHADMMRLTMEIIAKAIYDVDLHADVGTQSVGHALTTVLDEYTKQLTSAYRVIMSRLPISLPVPGWNRLEAAVAQIDRVISTLITERRATAESRPDLLSVLIAAQDDDGTRMTDQQLRDEVITLFLAGHETTANTLTWAFFLLGQHPEVEARVRDELQQVVQNRLPTAADYPRLTYVNQVIKEAMRLYPPVWWISRETRGDWNVRGYTIPAGSEVAMSQWVMHRDARYFPEPLAFKPERWTPQFEETVPKYAYFPFGGGPRLCIGAGFAQMEAVLLLATIVQHVHLDLIAGQTITVEPSITLRPKHGLQVTIQPRHKRTPSGAHVCATNNS